MLQRVHPHRSPVRSGDLAFTVLELEHVALRSCAPRLRHELTPAQRRWTAVWLVKRGEGGTHGYFLEGEYATRGEHPQGLLDLAEVGQLNRSPSLIHLPTPGPYGLGRCHGLLEQLLKVPPIKSVDALF